MGVQGGAELILSFVEECCAIAQDAGFAPHATFIAQMLAILTSAGSHFTALMLLDMEGNGPTEADHVLDDMLRRYAPRNVASYRCCISPTCT
jgi:2-dehydropantoate 2-reductase